MVSLASSVGSAKSLASVFQTDNMFGSSAGGLGRVFERLGRTL